MLYGASGTRISVPPICTRTAPKTAGLLIAMLTRALMDSHYGNPTPPLARSANLVRSPANQLLRTTEILMMAGFAALTGSRLRIQVSTGNLPVLCSNGHQKMRAQGPLISYHIDDEYAPKYRGGSRPREASCACLS